MTNLKKILSELLNTYQVEADLWTNSEFNITDVLNQIHHLHPQPHRKYARIN